MTLDQLEEQLIRIQRSLRARHRGYLKPIIGHSVSLMETILPPLRGLSSELMRDGDFLDLLDEAEIEMAISSSNSSQLTMAATKVLTQVAKQNSQRDTGRGWRLGFSMSFGAQEPVLPEPIHSEVDSKSASAIGVTSTSTVGTTASIDTSNPGPKTVATI